MAKKENENEIEIGFGTLFEAKGENNEIGLVVDVGKKDSFQASHLHKTNEGKIWIYLSGTSGRENIEKVIGELSPEEVIAAAEEGARQLGIGKLPNKNRKYFERNSRKKSRKLRS